MPFHPQRPISIAAGWSRKLGRFALLLALMAVVLHRMGMLTLPNAVAVILLAAFLAVFVFGLASIGFFMLWHIGAKGGHASFSGMVMALLVLAPVGVAASRYVSLPAIHDVSTDFVNAPQWLEPQPITPSWLPRSDADAPTARQSQLLAYPNITGRRYEGGVDRVLLAIGAQTAKSKWTMVAKTDIEYLIEGLEPAPGSETAEVSDGIADPARVPVPTPRPDIENTVDEPLPTYSLLQFSSKTLVLGVPQDVLIRLAEEEQTTYVDLRVATRDGDHDLGLNARLIQNFLRNLDIRLLGIAGG